MQKGWYDDVPEDRLHKELKSETLNKPHEQGNVKVQQSALPPLINFAPLVPPLNCLRKVWTEIEMWQEGFKIETHAVKFETWVPMRSVFFVDFCNGPNFIRAEKKMRKNNLYLKTETNLCRVASSFILVQHYSSPSENFAWKHNGGNQFLFGFGQLLCCPGFLCWWWSTGVVVLTDHLVRQLLVLRSPG